MKLYEIIKKQVDKSSLSYSILKLDNSIDINDLTHEVYLRMFNKNNDFVHKRIKQHLLNIYSRKKLTKIETSDIEYDKLDIPSNDGKIEENIIISNFLNIVKKQDEIIYNCLYYYFIKNMTYQEVANIVGISFRSVKNKIDKGLEIIANM